MENLGCVLLVGQKSTFELIGIKAFIFKCTVIDNKKSFIVSKVIGHNLIPHRSEPQIATCGQAATTLWDLTMQAPVKEYKVRAHKLNHYLIFTSNLIQSNLQWGVDSVHCVRFNPVETSLLGAAASDRSVILYDTRETRPMRKVRYLMGFSF